MTHRAALTVGLILLASCADFRQPYPAGTPLVPALEPLRFAIGPWSSTDTFYAADGEVDAVETGGVIHVAPHGGGRFLVLGAHFPERPDQPSQLWIFQPDPDGGDLLCRGTGSVDTGFVRLRCADPAARPLRFHGRLGPNDEGPPVQVTLGPTAGGALLVMGIATDRGDLLPMLRQVWKRP